MTAATIAELVIRLGPIGLDLAQKLAEVWGKPALSPEEVRAICASTRKSYDDYRREIVGSPLPPTTQPK